MLLQVMLMWFKPYGHVLELWPLEDPELHEETEKITDNWAVLIFMSP